MRKLSVIRNKSSKHILFPLLFCILLPFSLVSLANGEGELVTRSGADMTELDALLSELRELKENCIHATGNQNLLYAGFESVSGRLQEVVNEYKNYENTSINQRISKLSTYLFLVSMYHEEHARVQGQESFLKYYLRLFVAIYNKLGAIIEQYKRVDPGSISERYREHHFAMDAAKYAAEQNNFVAAIKYLKENG
jgi:hypothetical protein